MCKLIMHRQTQLPSIIGSMEMSTSASQPGYIVHRKGVSKQNMYLWLKNVVQALWPKGYCRLENTSPVLLHILYSAIAKDPQLITSCTTFFNLSYVFRLETPLLFIPDIAMSLYQTTFRVLLHIGKVFKLFYIFIQS